MRAYRVTLTFDLTAFRLKNILHGEQTRAPKYEYDAAERQTRQTFSLLIFFGPIAFLKCTGRETHR